MEDTINFPRGGVVVVAATTDTTGTTPSKNKTNQSTTTRNQSKKRNSTTDHHATTTTSSSSSITSQKGNDMLFGTTTKDDAVHNTNQSTSGSRSKKQKRSSVTTTTPQTTTVSGSNHHPFVSMGGGGCRISNTSAKATTTTTTTTTAVGTIDVLNSDMIMNSMSSSSSSSSTSNHSSSSSSSLYVLGICKSVTPQVAIFSLPNLWNAYMLPSPTIRHDNNNNNNNTNSSGKNRNTTTRSTLTHTNFPPLTDLLDVHQMVPLTIVYASQESGTNKRRIEVSCYPYYTNPSWSMIQSFASTVSVSAPPPLSTFRDNRHYHTNHTNTTQQNMTSGIKVRGVVVSLEEYGILLDLGFGGGSSSSGSSSGSHSHSGQSKRGFLLYTDIHIPYRIGDTTTTNRTITTDNDKNDGPLMMIRVHRLMECVVKPPPTVTTNTTNTSAVAATSTGTTGIIPLCIPTNMHQVSFPITKTSNSTTAATLSLSTSSLSDLIPGTCIHNVMVEQCMTNGLAVSFGPYRGAIDTSHIPGTYSLSYHPNTNSNTNRNSNEMTNTNNNNNKTHTWQDYYLIHQRIIPFARIIALDTVTKVLRLSLLPHALSYRSKRVDSPSTVCRVGTIIPNCIVVRVDPTIGAVLALPSEYNNNNNTTNDTDTVDAIADHNDDDDDDHPETTKPKKPNKKKPPVLSRAEMAHIEAAQVRVVYVPVSKAMDDDDDDDNNNNNNNNTTMVTNKKPKNNKATTTTTVANKKKLDMAKFMKQFSINTKHTVRIMQVNDYMMDNILLSGGTSSKIISAHVLSHADLIPGQVMKQVPILSHIRNTTATNNNENVSIMIDFGLGVHGLIPSMHLFDSNNTTSTALSAEHRRKVMETKYGIGTKLDVRILSVDSMSKKCFCTCKKLFVKAPMDQMITSYKDITTSRIGQIVMGYISKIDVTKGLCVTFCNNVFGRVPIRSIQMELGMDNDDLSENYACGDVVLCRIVHIKQRKNNGNKLPHHRSSWLNQNIEKDDNDENQDMEIDENTGSNDGGQNMYCEITLSLRVDGPDISGDSTNATVDDNDKSVVPSTAADNVFSSKVPLSVGTVVPLNSLRVVQLVPGKERGRSNGYVPGYAIVSVRSRYIINESDPSIVTSTLPPFIECKLPYDQLLDTYSSNEIQTVKQMDAIAVEMLKIGKKINRKGLLLSDPRKSQYEYTNGLGALAVVTIRPTLIAVVEQQKRCKKIEKKTDDMDDNDDTEDVMLPGPHSHFHVGGLVIGYVATIDERHGAFVRFLDGMTGLVPKTQNGLHLQLYSTVTVSIVAVDDKFNPPKILLGLAKQIQMDEDDEVKKNMRTDNKSIKRPPLKSGDNIGDAVVDKIDFHRATIRILDDTMSGFEETVKVHLHCTMVHHKAVAPSKPRKKKDAGYNATDQQITVHHPFFKWKVGDKLSTLRVLSVEIRGKFWIVELIDRNDVDIALLLKKNEELNTGDEISGIISGISKHKGLWMELSPTITAHVPALELSTDVNVLNSMETHFPIGSRLECVVLDKSIWESNRRKYYKIKSKEESKSKIPFLSLLGCNDTKPNSLEKPEIGELVVGRIDRTLPSLAAPDLMIDLRNGFIGRCCITELIDSDDWSNLPLGRSRRSSETLQGTAENDVQEDDTEEQTVTIANEQFGHGKFLQCRVIMRVPSKPIVEVSLRQSRLEGDLENDIVPEVGDSVQAFVIETSKKGCFLRLSRQIEGRTILKELCDGFLPDPVASFPMGRLVVGKIKTVRDGKRINGMTKMLADIDMRESIVMDELQRKTKLDDLEIGNKYKASVMRLEEYGVFVKLENCDISGLVHKSECSDKFIKNLSDLFNPGDIVKVVLLKKDIEKRQVGFGMKASYFADDDSDDEEISSDDEDVDNEMDGEDPMLIDNEIDSDDENYVAKLSAKMSTLEAEESERSNEDEIDHESNDDSSEEEDDDNEDSDTDEAENINDDGDVDDEIPQLDTNVGFDWSGGHSKSQKTTEVSDDSSNSSEEDDDNTKRKSQKSRQKQAQRLKEEQEINRREIALADGTADENPESSADFERMLAGDPNSSELWIRYMAFYLTMANIPAARNVANRAFDRIEFRQEQEKLNVWCALLTLELKYGTDATMQSELDRACQHNNPKHVHLRVCEMMVKQQTSNPSSGNISKTDSTFAKMCSKFRSKKTVWIAHFSYLFEQGRYEEAQKVIQRALLSLQTYKHVEALSKYALLAFTHGQETTARAVFDGLLTKHPKRLDLFFVYADQEVKNGNIPAARSLFQRVTSRGNKDAIAGTKSAANDEILSALKFNSKQMKRLFKKWYTFEEAHGTDSSQDRVKDAARAYVESSL